MDIDDLETNMQPDKTGRKQSNASRQAHREHIARNRLHARMKAQNNIGRVDKHRADRLLKRFD
jgi:hypothetical protein